MGLLDSILPQGVTPNPMALALLGGQGNTARLQTQQQILRQQLMAQQLQATGSKTGPVGSWAEGAARLADTLAGDRLASQASDATAASAAHAQAAWGSALGQASAPPAPGSLAEGLGAGAPPAGGSQMAGGTPGDGGFDIGGLIDQAGAKYGIDPNVARRVFASEGGAGYVGDNGSSFGPFQLHYGGVASGGNAVAGMGDDFTKATGLDARDPTTVPQQVDYVMSHVGQTGWSPFHGAQAAGIGNFDGIGQPPQQTAGNAGGAPPSPALAYAPPAGGSQPATGGAMGAIQSAAGPGAGLSQGVQPQASAASGATPDPSGNGAPPPAAPPTQVAMNGIPTPNGSNGAPISAPQPRAAASSMNPQALLAIMTDPYMPPEQQQMAAQMYSTLMTPKPVVSAGEGYLYDPNRGAFIASPGAGHNSEVVETRDGSKVMVDPRNPNRAPIPIGPQGSGSAYRPATSQERNAYNLSPDVKMTVDPKGKPEVISGAAGDDSYSKQLTEGLGKAHAQLANGVEEAQTRGRDLNAMQGALQRIQANGGTTGGLGQQEILDLKKAVNNGASALGISAPFGDLSDPEFLTKFNRQIAAAAASSGSNGGRVTNFAIQNMLKANPGLELTPQGNTRLIGIQQQIEARNVAVGQSIRNATADAVSNGQHVQPGAVEKLIRDYDNANHITDPLTGQDLTANPAIKDYQNGGKGTAGPQNPGQGVAPQQGGQNATPKSQADYDALPHGALFTAPDGSTRRKP